MKNENNKSKEDSQVLQVMSMTRNGVWNWFTVDKDLQEDVLKECIEKRRPHRLIDTPSNSVEKLAEEAKEFENILSGMVDIAPTQIHSHMRPYILEAMREASLWQNTQRTNAVIELIEARIAEYLQLIHLDSTGWHKYVIYKSASDELTGLLTRIKELK